MAFPATDDMRLFPRTPTKAGDLTRSEPATGLSLSASGLDTTSSVHARGASWHAPSLGASPLLATCRDAADIPERLLQLLFDSAGSIDAGFGAKGVFPDRSP